MMSLINLIKSALTDWPFGTLFGIVLIVTILLTIALILAGTYIAIDSWFQPKKSGLGKVVSKKFTPAQTTTVMIGNPSSPVPIHRPANWSVTIEVDGRSDSMSVSHKDYDSLSVGAPVEAEYVTGRISGDFYLKAFQYI